MTPTGGAVLAGVSAVFATIGLYGFLTRMRRDRAVADTPLARLRSAAQGYVKVTGQARTASGAPTPAPLSGRPCVWWNYSVWEQRGVDQKGHPDYMEIERGTSVDPFVLEEDDARCLVSPVRAEVTPTVFNLWYGGSKRPAGPPPDRAVSGGPYQYREEIIAAGGGVCVVGEFRSHSETGDASAAIAVKLHEWKQDQKTLLARFDADHDGALSAAEWDAARAAAAQECQAQNLKADIARVSVISKPADGKPFLIAALSPDKVERREKVHAWGYFAWGFAWVLVCVWALSVALS
jgi:hypothetical protein